ncbi:hypothetical protein E0W68_09950 [Flavobacterium salilacus subsp. salilacus]|uniref:hypothetical protein n=1 Tax=Flavobacterium TaxID=237 RepID=UPI0010755F0D|nr:MULTISPECIES: hypothetical protein [Flavobacterium]KAF2518334.1 hypothetical protein E0W68_09950 [Flavobacterium salilacus subsp. salilacus]MBE1615251.1 hypothetical protein [Flavobacterium sp. SaA2.13]
MKSRHNDIKYLKVGSNKYIQQIMKKLFLFLLGITFLISCSNDTQETTTFNDTSADVNSTTSTPMLKSASADPVLKQLYIDMINSQSYIAFNNAVITFNDKLGDQIPDSEMSSSSKMLGWVQNNITQTGFLNYQEAVDKWDDVEALSTIAFDTNYTFFDYLAGTAPGTLLLVIEEVEPTPLSCEECQAQFNSCSKVAHSAYTAAVEKACDQRKLGNISKSDLYKACTEAGLARDKALRKCHEGRKDCCEGN